MTVGVLSLQGSFYEHLFILSRLNTDHIQVKTSEDLSRVTRLIIPGGESTAMLALTQKSGLFDLVRDRIVSGMPVYGTCAGMIMLSTFVEDFPNQKTLSCLDIAVRRNAFGRQINSFESEVSFLNSKITVPFIRAPKITQIGEGVDVLSRLESGDIVAVRQGNVMATAFHPELTGGAAVHEYFLHLGLE